MLIFMREHSVNSNITYENINNEIIIVSEIWGGYFFEKKTKGILTIQKENLADFTELELKQDTENEHDCFAIGIGVKHPTNGVIQLGFLSKKLAKHMVPINWICLKAPTPKNKSRNQGANIMLINKGLFDFRKLDNYKDQVKKLFTNT